jgi:minimal PKS acyl carrier protein
MGEFTLNDLLGILRVSGGETDPAYSGAAARDVPLADLGYDSLAVLDAMGRVRRQFGVVLSDDAVTELLTPGAVVDYVNDLLSAGV